MFTKHLETPIEFVRWISTKQTDENIGIKYSATQCPIAMFLRSLELVPPRIRISVGLTRIGVIDPDDFNSLYAMRLPELTPDWVSEFILAVDSLPTLDITAGNCFVVLTEQKLLN